MSGVYVLLDQDEWWEPKDGPPKRVNELAPSHVRRLLAWLERRAPALKSRYEWSIASFPYSSGEAAQDCFDQAQEELWKTPVSVWFEQFPLIKKLRELDRLYRQAELKTSVGSNHLPAGATAGLTRRRANAHS